MNLLNIFRKKEKNHILWHGPEGCLATDRITKNRLKVGYMYREATDSLFPDSGWRFFEGSEDDAYLDNPENTHIFRIQTICDLDPAIIPYLHAPFGTAWERQADGTFCEVPFEVHEDE